MLQSWTRNCARFVLTSLFSRQNTTTFWPGRAHPCICCVFVAKDGVDCDNNMDRVEHKFAKACVKHGIYSMSFECGHCPHSSKPLAKGGGNRGRLALVARSGAGGVVGKLETTHQLREL